MVSCHRAVFRSNYFGELYMDDLSRDCGFYWVKQAGEWEIMRWSGVWHCTDEMEWYDRELDEIDERRITRD